MSEDGLFRRIRTAIRLVVFRECPMCSRRPDEAGHLKRIVDQPYGQATERGYIPCPLCRTERFRVADNSHVLVNGVWHWSDGSLRLRACDPKNCPRCYREKLDEQRVKAGSS